MNGSKIDAPRARGRPRGFDEGKALDAAMRIFWTQGYDAASVESLSTGMGVPRASLYNLFGDKEHLFLAAVAAYADGPFAGVVEKLNGGGTLKGDLLAFFDALIRLTAPDKGARGCLVSSALADAAGENDAFRAELARRLTEIECAICRRLEQGLAAGEKLDHMPVGNLARVVTAVARGLTVSARAGVDRAQLSATGEACVKLVLSSD